MPPAKSALQSAEKSATPEPHIERDENDQRKEPTTSEKVALAEAIAERLQGRQLANLVQNRGGNISTSDETGKTRDIAAAKAGISRAVSSPVSTETKRGD